MQAESNYRESVQPLERVSFKIKASSLLAAAFFLSLVMPTMHLLPASLGPLDRSLEEFWDFFLIGAWLALLALGGLRKTPLLPRYLRTAMWIVPGAIFLSLLVNILRPATPSMDDLYAILWALRPIAILQLVGYLCVQGRLTQESALRLLRKAYGVINLVLMLTCSVAILQALKLPFIFRLNEIFYSKVVIYQGLPLQRSLQAIEVYKRATSIFPWANHFGMFVAISMLLLIPVALNKRGFARLLAFIPLSFGLAGLVLSGSRTTVFMLALGVFLLLRRQARLLPYIVLGMAALLLLFSVTSQLIGANPRVLEVVTYVQGEGPPPQTVVVRLNNYQKMLAEVFDPWWNAPAGFSVSTYNSNHPEINRTPFDNEYLKYTMHFGLLGLAAFIWQISGLVIFASRTARRYGLKTPNGQLAAALFAAMLPMAVAALVQDVWGLAKVIHLVFFMLGILLYLNKVSPPAPAHA